MDTKIQPVISSPKEVAAILDDFSKAHMQALYGVGRIDNRAHLGRIAFCFFGFFVVITSVMEFPFRYYFMTPFTQKT